MTTDLIRFTQWARESPQRQYTSLMGMLYDPDGLNASFERQAANKAPGVDGMRKADYGEGSAERWRIYRHDCGVWGIDPSR
jgi:RNA-directed DNA polymerase